MAKAQQQPPEIKLFDRWTFGDVQVQDQGLVPYINLTPMVVPKTNSYHHNSPFYKTKINIVERFMMRLMVTGHKGKKHKISTGHNTGKLLWMSNLMYEVFDELEKKTKQNPLQVFVTAIENSAPREEVITIERSGARYAQAVDMAPQRRVDLVLRYLAQGASHRAFDSSVSLKESIVGEVMDAYNLGDKSMARNRCNEIEKMASNRKNGTRQYENRHHLYRHPIQGWNPNRCRYARNGRLHRLRLVPEDL